MEEDKLIELFKDQPAEGLSRLFDKYIDYLSAEVFFILKDEDDTQDVIQDLFMTLWKNKEHLSNINTSIKSYLRKAAINKSLNLIRSRKQYLDIDDNIDLEEGYNHATMLETAELGTLLNQTIDNLPPKCRQIFVLSRYEEMSYKEISESLGVSVKTVENQISKALKILRIIVKKKIGVNIV